MTKKEARKIFNKKRQELGYSEKLKGDDLILIHFQTVDLPFLDAVFSFYPMEDRNEVNVLLLTDYLRFRNPGLQLCYPKMAIEEPDMEAIACKADTVFAANAISILEPLESEVVEPEALDLVIVPLLACDLAGNRVGYGKGYYDRYLSRCRPNCIKLGVSYFEPIAHIEDANEFDVPLDFCITPQKVYVF